MSARQLRLLVIALAGLLALWGASRMFSHGSDVVSGRLTLPALSSGNTDSVIITHETDTVRLTRDGQRWSVNGYRASPQAVRELFLALRDSSPPDVAAVSSSSFERMGVDSAQGWWLRVHGGGRERLQLVIGKAGQEYATGYVRRPGSDTVFLWRGRLPVVTRRTVDEWRDHRIAAVPADSVRRVQVRRGRQRYALTAAGGHWRFAAGGSGEADSAKVASFLGHFDNVEGTRFATEAQADSSRRRPPQRSVTLWGPGDSVLAELSFDSLASGYWVRRTGDSTVYRMDAWQVKELTPADSTLRLSRAKTPAAADSAR